MLSNSLHKYLWYQVTSKLFKFHSEMRTPKKLLNMKKDMILFDTVRVPRPGQFDIKCRRLFLLSSTDMCGIKAPYAFKIACTKFLVTNFYNYVGNKYTFSSGKD